MHSASLNHQNSVLPVAKGLRDTNMKANDSSSHENLANIDRTQRRILKSNPTQNDVKTRSLRDKYTKCLLRENGGIWWRQGVQSSHAPM